MKAWAKQKGFTIVELLIVIVVIGILAGISIVAYNGIQERAAKSSADSAISQVAKKVKMYALKNGSYPADLSALNLPSSNEVSYDYAASDEAFCLSATVRNVSRSIGQSGNLMSGDCQFALVKWDISGGVTYNADKNQLELSTTQSGAALTPFIHNDGASSVRITTEAYVTQPSVRNSPLGSNYFSSKYFGDDKVTQVENTSGYKGNGHAACDLPLNQWSTCTWNVATGPNVEWVQFVVRSSPGNYTSDNKYRNIEFTVND